MVLYYALGGGLGHLTRARRLLSALGLSDSAAVLSASRFSRDPRVLGELPVVEVPARLGRDRAAFRRWLIDALAALAPEELIVDSFPGGILGELCDMQLPPARYVARRLRWAAYRRRLPTGLPRYELVHVLEPLEHAHALALEGCAHRVQTLDLPLIEPPLLEPPRLEQPLIDRPHSLVVHSGSDDEVVALAEYASELRLDPDWTIVVVSPHRPSQLPAGALWRDVYPAAPHLAYAEQLVTAAGFNAMGETAALRERHRFVPFPRALDDQFARAGFARTVLARTTDAAATI
jgi:hypothetical protein